MLIQMKTYHRKTILTYALAVFVCVIYLFFIDIRFGVSFLAFLLLLPILSLTMLRAAASGLNLTCYCKESLVSKGDGVELVLQVEGRRLFAFCFLRISLFHEIRVANLEENVIIFTLGSRFKKILMRRYLARIAGVADLGIEGIYLIDFLGFCQYTLEAGRREAGKSQKLQILPEIPLVAGNDLLRELRFSPQEDDEEEESTSHLPVHGGVAGFEHRDYQPGDSFKRINWKLSSKLDRHMVRLDEPLAQSKYHLVLHYLCPIPHSQADKNKAFLLQEQVMEGLLAFCQILLKQNLECYTYILADKQWHSMLLQKEADLLTLQHLLANHEFFFGFPPVKSAAPELLSRGGAALLFSVYPMEEVKKIVDTYRHQGRKVELVYGSKDTLLDYHGAWFINEDYTFSKQ